MTRSLCLLVAIVSVGCSSASDAPGAPGDEDAILSRQSLDTYTCRVDRPSTRYEPTQNSIAGPSLAVTTAGKAFIGRIDHPFPYPEPVDDPSLFVASIDTDGTLGTRTQPDPRSPMTWGSPTIARYDDGLAVVWNADGMMRVAVLGPDGAVMRAPTNVPGTPSEMSYAAVRPRVVQGEDGKLGIAYASSGNRTTVNFVVLGRDLAPVAPSRVIDDLPQGYSIAFNVVASRGGYAFAYAGMESESPGVYFAAADASGAETAPPRRIATGAVLAFGFEANVIGLLHTTSGYLASWTEHADRSSVARLARLDVDGAVVGKPVSIRKAEDAIDEVEPSVAPFGDSIALLWARGSHIFECGGCVPDHRIDLVLVDAETLDPLSDVVSVERTAQGPQYQPSGGLLSRESVVLGQKILTAYHQQYHTTADLASATFECEAR